MVVGTSVVFGSSVVDIVVIGVSVVIGIGNVMNCSAVNISVVDAEGWIVHLGCSNVDCFDPAVKSLL